MSQIIKLSTSDSRKRKGQVLSRIDNEQKMMESGTLGVQRLLMNIALDFMEKHPQMTWEQALFAAQAYCDRTYN
ncbi:hypothetical protein [Pseudoalteromonas rubra]|uniref:Uncharacterized protein n=1 Tax=Pseudoalteromonas rubra TaxID=43658 RepID=A0A0F4QK98_9GAMM|nr:hypothetical protein [Pseudoalteromonas rubra]KJZ07082.1 hypothetical protein TW77_16485 [Pseudoalteromonas rubra]